MKNKLLKLAGYILTLLAIAFIVKKLLNMNIEYSMLFTVRHALFALACILTYTAVYFTMGVPWRNFVRITSGVKLPVNEVFWVFTRSNLMKYIPGNVFQYVGRNEIAVTYELKHKDVALATVLDIASNAASALLIAIVFYFTGMLNWILSYITIMQLILIVTMLCIFAAATLCFIKLKMKRLSFIFEKDTIITFVKSILYYMIFHGAEAILYIVVLVGILGCELHAQDIRILIGTWNIAWIFGFVVPGAPGGMGIREVILIFLLGGSYQENTILLAAIVLRMTTIIGEMLSVLCAMLMRYFVKKKIGMKQEDLL